MKLRRARVYLLVDLAIGVAFLVEVVSGFVLWLVLPHGGYQGGRNPLYQQAFILGRDAWLSLHDWFALVMVLGVLVHLVLHWRWIVGIFRNLWREAFSEEPSTEAVPEKVSI